MIFINIAIKKTRKKRGINAGENINIFINYFRKFKFFLNILSGIFRLTDCCFGRWEWGLGGGKGNGEGLGKGGGEGDGIRLKIKVAGVKELLINLLNIL